jgi:hypothetical protein
MKKLTLLVSLLGILVVIEAGLFIWMQTHPEIVIKTVNVPIAQDIIQGTSANDSVSVESVPQENQTAQNPAPTLIPKPVPIQYSPFTLQPQIVSGGSCSGINYTFNRTDRNIVIENISVNATGMSSGQTIGYKFTPGGSSPHIMQTAGNGVWQASVDIPLQDSSAYDPTTIQIYASGSCGGNASIYPNLSEWKVWDKTSNQVVQISPVS